MPKGKTGSFPIKLKSWLGFDGSNGANESSIPAIKPEEHSFKGKTVSVPHKFIFAAAYFYMVIPIAVFFLTWLKWYIGVTVCAILLFGLWNVLKGYFKENQDVLILPVKHILIVLLLIVIWLYSSSFFFYQTWDNHWRNAILRDLIDYSWPVIYNENKCALDYYFMQWMIPALAGKLFGFTVANAVLLAVNSIGVFLAFLCICMYVKPKKISSVYVILLIFIGWQGLNDIGYAWIDVLQQGGYMLGSGFGWPDMYYGYGYQYTPNDALLAWVYNQTIVPWLVTSLYMVSPDVKNYAFLGLCALPYGPIPFVGIFVFLISDFIGKICKDGFVKTIKVCVSVQNVCAITSIFPVFLLMFKANVAAGHVGFYNIQNAFDIHHIVFLVVFYLLEFGIYCILIGKDHKHTLAFWVAIISLIIIPHIQIGYGRDFCMRASIPALFVLMFLVIQYVIRHGSECLKPTMTILIVCLTISCYGIAKDFACRIKSVRLNDWRPIISDEIVTLSNKDKEGNEQFIVPNYNDTAFFKYLARSNSNNTLSVSEDLSEIKSITAIDDYFDYLINKDCTVYIAVQDIQGYSLKQETIDKIKQLGFNDDLDVLLQWEYHSFIGIVNNGRIVAEQIGGDQHISYQGEIDGYPVKIESATLNAGNFSTINIRGRDYSVKGRGLNIVIRDNSTGCVIDSVAFDTHVDEMVCYRSQ